MASREFLKIMKSARSGDALAQQKIGEIYLLGEQGTPKNFQNALLWLEKASVSIGFNETIFNLIANQFDLSVQLPLTQSNFAWKCVSHAANAGNTQARWIFAKVVSSALSSSGFECAAFSSMSKQYWMDSVEELGQLAHRYLEELSDLSSFAHQTEAKHLLSECLQDGRLGIEDISRSQKLIANLAIESHDVGLSSLLSLTASSNEYLVPALKKHLATLLAIKKPSAEHASLYWAAWQYLVNVDALEIAAELSYGPAQLALGLRLAKLDGFDDLVSSDTGNARLKKAVYWLKLAGNQGERDAWYALGLISRMPQYSGYSAQDSDDFFDKAADLGHAEAQYRKGASLWRKRAQLKESIEGLQASYWVWHAAQQGVVAAQELLSKIMLSHPNASSNDWAALAHAVKTSLDEIGHRFTGDMLLMCHRVIVANQLNLSRAELLLADIGAIQHEHGAIIDIREHLPRSSPKLILIETLEQRKALMLVSRAFSNALTSGAGDEGNLRQRRYRLEKLAETLGLTLSLAQDPQDQA